MDEQLRQKLIRFQRNEITEYHVYKRLAKLERNPQNQAVLQQIAEDELRHYRIWLGYTEEAVKPDKWKIAKHYWIAKLFGVTFGIKLMERAESGAQHDYAQVVASFAEAKQIADEEEVHENALIGQIDEDLLKYTGSVVLGINDALVELTGALAGLTLALGNAKLIALTGSVTGIAAAFSMAASEYLSTKTEAGEGKQPVRAAVYTGIAYLVTVVSLIAPYLIIPSLWGALGATMAVALGIIFLFNFYIAIAQDQPFKKRFVEMALLSLSVAALSFGVGFVMRRVFNIEV